ncbi:hypothetical protein OPV22_018265 [Ensete ventricosum]|uniref:Uncharacterized protein n=1 Tax=Ensete ventricosum TaxID=4639 RepID=A0AAV8QVL8_ENSVE|nr:hypothetical protein OPV22_018265 [Ensete ventricosum]
MGLIPRTPGIDVGVSLMNDGIKPWKLRWKYPVYSISIAVDLLHPATTSSFLPVASSLYYAYCYCHYLLHCKLVLEVRERRSCLLPECFSYTVMLGEGEDVSSECSSGCQSGWTTYLDHSSCEPLVYSKGGVFHGKEEEEEEEEEEDLSMVSDASSGPPHFQEEDEHWFYYLHSSTGDNGCLCSSLAPTAELAEGGGKKRRVEPKQQRKHSSLLDDTASSPPIRSSKTSFIGDDDSSHMMPPIASVLEFSCGFSATHHFKRNHAPEKQMGYLRSSAPVKPTPSRPVK